MAYQAAGVEELYLAPGGAVFPADGTGAFGLGEGDEAKLEIGPQSPITLKGGQEFPTLRNFKVSKKTRQLSVAFLKFLLGAYKANDITVKAITSGIAKTTDFTATGGIFTFENAKSMGLDFELLLSPTERSLLVTVEKAYPETDGIAIVTAAATDTLPGTLHIPALDAANTLKAYISPSFGSITIADDRLDDWSISLKTRTNKTKFNKSRGKMIDVEIKCVMDGPDTTEINTMLASGYAPDITISMGVSTPYNIVLKSGRLTQIGNVEIDEDKRTVTTILKGSYSTEFMDLTGSGVELKAQL